MRRPPPGVCCHRHKGRRGVSHTCVTRVSRKGRGMRRVVLLLATMAATLVVASGLVLAVNKIGTNGPDTLWGTNGDDNLIDKGGNDTLFARDGRDNLVGG